MAEFEKVFLDLFAARMAVLIAKNDEAGLIIVVTPNLPYQLFFKVLLALERDASKGDIAVR